MHDSKWIYYYPLAIEMKTASIAIRKITIKIHEFKPLLNK